ncbi:GAF and ANTAR domain-containing protein [Kribbella sp. NPDC049174]|uniref:GAF and ANTAR domain-containing protein n=1 Tax=Kribbella sp. NPDC049174 TaxID=3364112 RepID=UPI0037126148
MSTGPSPGRATAEIFGRLAVELHAVGGVEETVEAVVQFALQAVRCKYASVVLIARGRRPQIMATTDPNIAGLFHEQIEARAGPLLTTIAQQQVVLIPDVATETRWSPQWAEQITAVGVRSALHLPLIVHRRTGAVLSLFSDQPGAFDADDIAVAHILARHAAVAIAAARDEFSMTQAVDARKLVDQAMGILMERYDLDADRAFEVLKRYSQHHNRKLHDVAQELIDTRHLPR